MTQRGLTAHAPTVHNPGHKFVICVITVISTVTILGLSPGSMEEMIALFSYMEYPSA